MVLPPAPASSPTSATSVLPRGATGETQTLPRARHRTGPVPPAQEANVDKLAAVAVRRRRRGAVWLSLVVVLALLAGGAGWWFGAGPGAQIAVPDVTGQDPAAATSALQAAGLTVATEQRTDFSPTVPAGQVTATDPSASSRVARDRPVTLVVSQGPQQLDLPTVVGLSEDDARAALGDFTVGDSSTQFDPAVPEGAVIAISGVDDSGSPVDLGSAAQYGEQRPVTLTVSAGPVPDVSGQSLAEAQAALAAVSLSGQEAGTEFSDTVASGSVIRSEAQTDGVLVPGATLDLIVSKGPAPVTVPDVTGKTIDDAVADLRALGLRVTYDKCTNFTCAFFDWEARLTVTATDPAPGGTAARGSTIALSYRVE
jgi:beta-lactam-binding protein with PASTA domain